MKRRAPCHPDKWVYARNMCINCYVKWLYDRKPELRLKWANYKKEYTKKYKEIHPTEYTEQQRKYQTKYKRTHRDEINARQRERYRTSEEYREKGRVRQHRRMLKKRGFAEEDYQTLLVIQEKKCAICKAPMDGQWHEGPQPDHNHANGKARGLLCNDCNTRLGKIEDEDWRKLADAYLARFEVVGVVSEISAS